jgi:hypothetical protein
MKTEVKQYFNPDQHLTLHQDKDGNMIGGGYQVNNLLYQHKMPLFVSLDDIESQRGGGAGGIRDDDNHFIPEKFSDLFRDLAVPAGLFMMPALFRPRNYAFEVAEAEAEPKTETNPDVDADTSESDRDDDADRRKPVPKDIFDRLLELVTPSERVQHDVKTRKHRRSIERRKHSKHNKNTTKRARSYME